MQLQNNTRFQEEYQLFYDKLQLVTDTSVKLAAEQLLRELVQETRNLDTQHYELPIKKPSADGFNISRSKIITIRKKLALLLN